MKLRSPDIAFVLIFCFLIFALGFVVGSSSHARYAPDNKIDSETRDDYYKPYRALRDWAFGDATGFFTLLLVAVGGFQVALFYVQLSTMRESLDDAKVAAEGARDSAKATAQIAKSDRAWVCVEEITGSESINCFVDGIPSARALGITPKWRNVGRSPALRALVIGDSKITNLGEAIPTFTPDRLFDQERVTIPSNIPVTSNLGFDEKTYTALEQRELRLFVYLAAFYFDVYSPDEEHITEVCVEVILNGKRIKKSDGTVEPNIVYRVIGQQNRMT
jgi:hypothetical protein